MGMSMNIIIKKPIIYDTYAIISGIISIFCLYLAYINLYEILNALNMSFESFQLTDLGNQLQKELQNKLYSHTEQMFHAIKTTCYTDSSVLSRLFESIFNSGGIQSCAIYVTQNHIYTISTNYIVFSLKAQYVFHYIGIGLGFGSGAVIYIMYKRYKYPLLGE